MSTSEEHFDHKKAVRCLLWGTGRVFWEYYYLIKHYELTGVISVSGIILDDQFYSELCGYRIIEKQDISKIDIDSVIVLFTSRESINEVRKEALSKGIAEYSIVPVKVMNLYGFDFEKYIKIKMDPPTIFSPSCWGGITYNRLGLRFDSPLINMFEDHDDYIKFLRNPKFYFLKFYLEYKGRGYDSYQKRYYPIAQCGDIVLHFNHYKSFGEANMAWNRRKTRVNWDNLFVMMYDNDPERVDRFLSLPYRKKVCFVSYHTERKNVISIENYISDVNDNNKTFDHFINGMASGKYMYYNVFDLLLYGKCTPVEDTKFL